MHNSFTGSQGRYARAVYTGRIHGPYIRPVYTGALFDTRIYGPYTRVTQNAPVYTARIYGPYTTPVHSHNSLQRIYAMNNVIFNSLVRCVYYMHNRQLFAIMSKITRKKKLFLLLAITARRARRRKVPSRWVRPWLCRRRETTINYIMKL